MYKYIDYKEKYGRIMQFGKNKTTPIHRWYPFVEGYSREFIESIINEQSDTELVALDPFSGSGTTALELQRLGIKCYSFEVNPFMYNLSNVKLKFPQYKLKDLKKNMQILEQLITNVNEDDVLKQTNFRTLLEKDGLKKWNLDIPVYIAIEKIKIGINQIKDDIYVNLFEIALASILLDVSNLYRNGKCLSYKRNWMETRLNENEVISKFFDVLNNTFLEDVRKENFPTKIDNSKFIFEGDSRELISDKIPDSSLDIVITSPPYLNSRDYTDSYMLELKALGYVETLEDIRELRKQTLRSHVQLKMGEGLEIENELLQKTMDIMMSRMDGLSQWNEEIPKMILAYFIDIEALLQSIFFKLKKGGKIYFNVSNSAYYNTLINTLDITASLAEKIGFSIDEIREARYLNPSPQQKDKVGKLLEGVIIITK
ncbi:hypothetical protein FG877_02725 [Enterococcus casseliflavus]|nr:hypothetical protein [Enterococcus casseliflavus]